MEDIKTDKERDKKGRKLNKDKYKNKQNYKIQDGKG
jgi:hypothetical protein